MHVVDIEVYYSLLRETSAKSAVSISLELQLGRAPFETAFGSPAGLPAPLWLFRPPLASLRAPLLQPVALQRRLLARSFWRWTLRAAAGAYAACGNRTEQKWPSKQPRTRQHRAAGGARSLT